MAQPLPPHIKRLVDKVTTNILVDWANLVQEVWDNAHDIGYNAGWDKGYSDAQNDMKADSEVGRGR